MSGDLYSVLGVKSDATENEIKSAYRALARELHPDKTRNDPQKTERFRAATQAFEILSDPARRIAYDARRQEDEPAPPPQVREGVATICEEAGGLAARLAQRTRIGRRVARGLDLLDLDPETLARKGGRIGGEILADRFLDPTLKRST